jgi:multidrug efflux pump subunit AcrA (membrane-fusion protein)
MSERVMALRLDKGNVVSPPRHRRKWWLLLFCLLLAIGIYAYSTRPAISSLLPARQMDAITLVAEDPVPAVLSTTGYVVARSVANISPRVPGTVVEVNFEEGQPVRKGDLLVRLDDTQFLADLNGAKATLAATQARLDELRKGAREVELLQAQSSVDQAEARRKMLETEYRRLETLAGSISPSELNRARAGFEEARAILEGAQHALKLLQLGAREERILAVEGEVATAKAAVDRAQYLYDGTNLRAPVSGTVIERTIEVGEVLRFDTQTLTASTCKIADLEHLEIEIDIPERDIAGIRLGQKCRITTEAYPDRQYAGQLDWLAPVYINQRGVRQAKITITNADDKLAPDMNCQVQIYNEAPPDDQAKIVRVPAAAVQRQAQDAFVYVLVGDAARRRQVELGSQKDDTIEVVGGLANGETVLLFGDEPPRDGQRVKARPIAPNQST